MALQLQWSIEGEQQLSRVMRGINGGFADLTKPFSESAKKLKSLYEGEVFSSRGAVIGERWERLSPYTVAQKARQGYPLDPLIRTGAMRDSFKTLVTSDHAEITNTAEYFKYHQSNQPRTRIPRRVMMKLGENQKQLVVKEFQKYIIDVMKKAKS